MQIILIGEYECSVDAQPEPALLIHHVPLGHDVVRMDAAAVAELGDLLRTTQKRIRTVGGMQVIFGAAGDLSIYAANGRRACYFRDDQARQLRALLEDAGT